MLLDLFSIDPATKNALRALKLRYVKDLKKLDFAELAWWIGEKRAKHVKQVLVSKGYRLRGELGSEALRLVTQARAAPAPQDIFTHHEPDTRARSPREELARNARVLPPHMTLDGKPDFERIAAKGEVVRREPAMHFAMGDEISGRGFRVLCFETIVPNASGNPERVTCKRCLTMLVNDPIGSG